MASSHEKRELEENEEIDGQMWDKDGNATEPETESLLQAQAAEQDYFDEHSVEVSPPSPNFPGAVPGSLAGELRIPNFTGVSCPRP